MNLGSNSNFEFRSTDKRVEIYRNALDRLGPLTSYKSDAPVIDEATRLGSKYVDRMRDAKKEYEEIEEEIEELEERKEELKNRWETEEIRFSDL